MIHKVSAYLFPALLLGMLFAAGRSATANPDDARNKGRDYLLETQLPVGGWISEQFGLTSTGHKLAITAVAAHALVATDPDEQARAAVLRAVGFLRHYGGELHEPHTNDGFDYTPWAAAYGLFHLDGLTRRWPKGEDAPDVADLIETFAEYAARTQRPCGGWDYRTRGQDGSKLVDGSVPFLTAVMLDGLKAWNVLEEVRKKAIVDLQRSTDQNGLLGYSHDGDHAEVSKAPWWSPEEAAGRTLQVRLVLARCGRPASRSLQDALQKFLAVRERLAAVRHEAGHTPPVEIAGYYYYHAHYYAMCALRHLIEEDPLREDWVEEQAAVLLEALLAEQNEDGSWEDAPAGGKAYATALALLSLREYRDIRVRWSKSVTAGLSRARRLGRPLVLLFLDQNEASAKMVRLFYESALADTVGSVVLLRLDRRSHPPVALRAKVYRGPALLVLDPRREEPLRNPLKKIIGGRDVSKVRAVLDKAIAEFSAEGR